MLPDTPALLHCSWEGRCWRPLLRHVLIYFLNGSGQEGLKPHTLPIRSPLNIWNAGESGRVWDLRDVPGVRYPGEAPYSGTLGHGGPTIFRPMYSQPGRTDSRKAFLWAPSGREHAWPQGKDFLPSSIRACPCERLPLPWEPGTSLCLCFPLALTVCLGPGFPECLSLSLSLSLSVCLSLWLCVQVPVKPLQVSPCDCTWLSPAPRTEGVP